MTDQINKAAATMPEDGWLIHKAGRGWYRPNAQGYTDNPLEAGRYTRTMALSYSHPNGFDGPRDGMTIRHETEVKGALPLPPVRFTREDVEKAARAICQLRTGSPDCLYQHHEWEKWPVDNRHEYKDVLTGEARVTLSHFAWRHWTEAATAALSAIGEVEHG